MVEQEQIDKAANKLTDAQRKALRSRQTDAFDRDAVVARGATIAALRRRGIVQGSMPHTRLTELGAAVLERLGIA